MVVEIVIGIAATALILGMALGSTLFAFVWYPRLRLKAMHKRFPLLTKQGLRVAKIPIRSIKLPELERAIDMFVDRAVEKGYDRKALLTEIGRTYLEFVRALNKEGKRYIIDAYGRKIAGDNNGEVMRVVVLDNDRLHQVAFFHEIGHMAHETKQKVDYDHTDDIMWHEVVGWCKKEFGK